MSMKGSSADDAAVLARELAERLQALATPSPGRPAPAAFAAPSAAAPGPPPRVSLAGPRSMVENGARFVTPVLPPEAHLHAAKKLLLRILRIVTRDQTVFNSAIAEALRSGLTEIEAALNAALGASAEARGAAATAREQAERLAESSERAEQARERLERTLSQVEARLSGISSVSDELADALTREAAAREALERDRDTRSEALARRHEREDETRARIETRLATISEEMRILQREWAGVSAPAAPRTERPAAVPAAPAPAGAQPLDPGDPLRAAVYFDFERRFRGSEASIRERQRADAERFRGVPGPVADLGCGRGEFVELLRDLGIPALGCDANPLMAARAQEKGLDVTRADLFEFLRAREDRSLGGIAAFQVVEHLPPALLHELVELAAAKLAPGGRILLETINPESVYAMRWFWMDLSHVRPVPAPSLEQLLAANGFRDVVVDFRSPVPAAESAGLSDDPRLAAVSRLLFAPQDYAVTGVK